MIQLAKELTRLAANISDYQPVFYRLNNESERTAFTKLLATNSPMITDDLVSNVRELVKSRNPTVTYRGEELHQAALDFLGDTPHEEYGVWVYFPWANRMVHILDELEFIEVRTNRNIYKITPEERDLLATYTVGVIGLSVGQSISLTMAMERSFGEIRVADFDTLELTNLNRIRTGLYNLGVKKAVIVAREIAEIDPFLKIRVFEEGITPENIDRFFTEGGVLDMLVDECDGLDIKVLARHKCKEYGIPLVQDMNDRGTLDVERFDLEPDRPLFHGTIDHLDLDPEKISGLTNEEKIPYLLPMIGMETLSTRLHASMLEVGQSITTWPQLASAVILGGGLAADTCRRIALDQFHQSGRWHIDLEELVADPPAAVAGQPITHMPDAPVPPPAVLNALIAKAATRVPKSTVAPDADALHALIEAASLAPSAGNMQPWKWLWKDAQLFLIRDLQRSGGIGDFDNICSNIALGAALENLVLKAHEQGLEVQSQVFPVADDYNIAAVASFDAAYTAECEPHPVDALAEAITIRCTNRTPGAYEPLPQTTLDRLQTVVETVPGAELQLLTSQNDIAAAAELIAGSERLRVLHPEGHHDFFVKELRWTVQEAETTRDGLDIRTIDLSESDRIGLWVARKPEVIQLLREWKGGEAMKKVTRNVVRGASALGLITLPGYNQTSFVNGGRAMQRVWLEANKQGIAFQPVSGSLFFFPRILRGNSEGMPKDISQEFLALRKQFEQLFEVADNRAEVFLFRLCNAAEPEVRALRRPVEDVLLPA